jgi:hypothetical protein
VLGSSRNRGEEKCIGAIGGKTRNQETTGKIKTKVGGYIEIYLRERIWGDTN